MKRILNDEQEQLVREERQLLGTLRVTLTRVGAGEDADATIERAIRQLDELFLLVIVGEFNAGKSAFINALVGQAVLQEGVTPTTTEVEILRYGDSLQRTLVEPHLFALAAPVDLLREIHIVDTPGTNAIMREHEVITSRFVPRADLVLFVTSADRPFTETERAFLERIRDWGKKVVVAVNKVDILEREEQVAQVTAFVTDNAARLLGASPEVFPVSARLALRAKLGEPALWEASRFAPLERYIRETLDEESRLRLKLLNPLGVASRFVEEQGGIAQERLGLLTDDMSALEDVDRQLGAYRADMARDFAFRMGDIEKVLIEMEGRGHQFFDETLRLGRVFDLMNKSRIQQGFEREVVADAPQRVEQKIQDLIDWLVDADFRQWQAVTAHLAERRRQYRGRIVEGEGAGFHSDRARLIDSVGREAHRVVETYDKERESKALADGARNAVAAAAAVGAGALGLGTLVTVAATTAAADVTGLVMASLMAAIGFFILPARRRKAKEEMRAKVTSLRENLAGALRSQFQREMQRGEQRLNEAIAPYTRFVRSEHERLVSVRRTLDETRQQIEALRARIEAATRRGLRA